MVVVRMGVTGMIVINDSCAVVDGMGSSDAGGMLEKMKATFKKTNISRYVDSFGLDIHTHITTL